MTKEISQNDKSRNSGMFQSGQSGNPGGRPKVDVSIRDLAREFTPQAIDTLAEICSNKKASPSARVSAASAILDRGWGKPTQSIESVTVATTLQEYLDRVAAQWAAEGDADFIDATAAVSGEADGEAVEYTVDDTPPPELPQTQPEYDPDKPEV